MGCSVLLTTLGVRSLVSHPPTLEEFFLRHYQANQTQAANRSKHMELSR